MKRISDRSVLWRTLAMQGVYWMIYCPISSYGSVYLLSKHFTNQQIGLVLAVNSILAVIMQPAFGAAADKAKKIPLKAFVSVLSLVAVLLLVGLTFVSGSWLNIAILYCLTLAIMQTLQPLINSMIFQFINAGANINFGPTRAMGSIAFATLSTAVGVWLNTHSTNTLIWMGIFLFTTFLLLTLFFPRVESYGNPLEQSLIRDSLSSDNSEKGFLSKYDKFMVYIIATAFLFIFHTIVNSYTAQIMTAMGGKDSDLGITLTICAASEVPAMVGFASLVHRFNIRSLLIASGVFYVIRSFVFLAASSVWWVHLGMAFQGLSFAIYLPASVYYVDHMMDRGDKVKGQTFVTDAMTLGAIFGSLIGGTLLDKGGVHTTLLFGSAAAIIGCLLMIYSLRKGKKNQTAAITEG